MISPSHHFIGGIVSTDIAAVGTLLNLLTLFVLCSDKKLRGNSTTILIIFMTISNLLFTSIVLPLNSVAMLKPQ
jgi:3-hydroxymyristoyl/3-hydroxydecanoyl-(acyl carrier protein) dehydratase